MEGLTRRRLDVDFDDVDLLDTRQFPLRDESDSLHRLERALRSNHQRYAKRGGQKRFVIHSSPELKMVVIWRTK